MIFEAGDGVFGIDLYEAGQPFRSCAYLIRDQEPALVETGSARSLPKLLEGLEALGVSPAHLRHLVVTHVHLDHAGAAGHLMQLASQALLHCHQRAARHLIDPSRLEQGARAVYGDRLESLYGSLQPAPAARVIAQPDQSEVSLGHRRLIFYDSPGHAKHHTCIVDTHTRGLFSGDTVGIRYDPRFTGWDFVYGFPTTTPTDFDPGVMLETLSRLEALGLTRVYHTHYGVTAPAETAFAFSRRGVQAILALLAALPSTAGLDDIRRALEQAIRTDIARLGSPVPDLAPLALDLELNSQGIWGYWQKHRAAPA